MAPPITKYLGCIFLELLWSWVAICLNRTLNATITTYLQDRKKRCSFAISSCLARWPSWLLMLFQDEQSFYKMNFPDNSRPSMTIFLRNLEGYVQNRISALKWKFPLGQSSLTSDDIPRSFGLFKIPWQIQVPQVFQECASCQITALCIWPILSMFHLSLLCTILLRSGVPACLLNMKIRHTCILTRFMKIWPYQGERTPNCNLLSFWGLSFWRQISQTEKESKSHQASILCESLRGLTSFLSPKTQ